MPITTAASAGGRSAALPIRGAVRARRSGGGITTCASVRIGPRARSTSFSVPGVPSRARVILPRYPSPASAGVGRYQADPFAAFHETAQLQFEEVSQEEPEENHAGHLAQVAPGGCNCGHQDIRGHQEIEPEDD